MAATTMCTPFSIGYVGSDTALQYILPTAQFVSPATGAVQALTRDSLTQAAAHFASSFSPTMEVNMLAMPGTW